MASDRDMVIRDWVAMEEFAGELNEYLMRLEVACGDLEKELDQARPKMRDETSREALAALEDMIAELRSSMPAAEEAREKLLRAAKPLKSL